MCKGQNIQNYLFRVEFHNIISHHTQLRILFRFTVYAFFPINSRILVYLTTSLRCDRSYVFLASLYVRPTSNETSCAIS